MILAYAVVVLISTLFSEGLEFMTRPIFKKREKMLSSEVTRLKDKMAGASKRDVANLQHEVLKIHFLSMFYKVIKQAVFFVIFIFVIMAFAKSLGLNMWIVIGLILLLQLIVVPRVKRCLK